MRSSRVVDWLLKLNIGDYAAEAVFFLFKMGESLLEPSLGLYIYQCVCLDHDRMTTNPGEACHNLSQYPEVERQVINQLGGERKITWRSWNSIICLNASSG
jgi:hypothetical protein